MRLTAASFERLTAAESLKFELILFPYFDHFRTVGIFERPIFRCCQQGYIFTAMM
jgi:hypothetical protein